MTRLGMSTIAALLAAAAVPGAASAEIASPMQTIAGTRLDVSATGEVRRVPDVTTISAGVVTQGTSAATAMAENARRMAATVAAIKRAGVADRDIVTSNLSLSPQYRNEDNQAPRITGYQASNQVSVRFRDVKAAGPILDALVAAGANQIDGPFFSVDQPDAALDEARGQAIAKARARAQLYATAMGMTVKRIVSVSEAETGSQPIRPMYMMARAMKADTAIEPGEQTLGVTVSMTFELQ